MNKKMPDFKAGFSKIIGKIDFRKIKFVKITKKNAPKIKNKPTFLIKKICIALVFFIAAIEIIFAISIYAFQSEDSATRLVARIIPYPAVITTHGVSTIAELFYEADYALHFYQKTDQAQPSRDEIRSQIAEQLAEDQIIKDQAIKFKVTVPKSDIDSTLDQIFQANGGEEEVGKALEDYYGLSVRDFRALVKRQLVRDKINKDIIMRVKVRHILIRVDQDASAAKVAEAKKRIDDYYKKITTGSIDFSDAAKKYSEDVGSSDNGGEIDAFARGDMIDEFEKVAFDTPIGEVSKPFRTSFGWHILEVQDRTGIIDQSFTDWFDGLRKSTFVLKLI